MPLRQEVRFLRERAQRLRQMAEAHQLHMMAHELEARADELERARAIENGGSSRRSFSPSPIMLVVALVHHPSCFRMRCS